MIQEVMLHRYKILVKSFILSVDYILLGDFWQGLRGLNFIGRNGSHR
jgi:hypothetical protein